MKNLNSNSLIELAKLLKLAKYNFSLEEFVIVQNSISLTELFNDPSNTSLRLMANLYYKSFSLVASYLENNESTSEQDSLQQLYFAMFILEAEKTKLGNQNV